MTGAGGETIAGSWFFLHCIHVVGYCRSAAVLEMRIRWRRERKRRRFPFLFDFLFPQQKAWTSRTLFIGRLRRFDPSLFFYYYYYFLSSRSNSSNTLKLRNALFGLFSFFFLHNKTPNSNFLFFTNIFYWRQLYLRYS